MGQPIHFGSPDGEKDLPVAKLARLFLWQAVHDKADHIVFELDLKAHRQIKAEAELATGIQRVDMTRFRNAFHVTFKFGNTEKKRAPASAYLFEPVMRVLLNAAEIPFWKKGDVSAELETANPASKWLVESKDLTQRIELRRIREQ